LQQGGALVIGAHEKLPMSASGLAAWRGAADLPPERAAPPAEVRLTSANWPTIRAMKRLRAREPHAGAEVRRIGAVASSHTNSG
jgi:hypothetical protein